MAANKFTQKFSRELESNLHKDNMYYTYSKKDSNANDAQVNIPVSGSAPGVSVNRSTLPATIAQRTDTAAFYLNNEFTSDPVLVQDSDEFQTAYNKRQDVMSDSMRELQDQIANYMAYYWASDSNTPQVRTSGSNRPATAPSATGTRKALTLADLLDVKTQLDSDNVPQGDRYAVITPAMHQDMLNIDEVKNSDYNNGKPLVNGSVGSFLGFTFFVRSSVNVFDNSATPAIKAVDAAGAATDNEGAIFWHRDFVRHSEGNLKVYMDTDKPEYYGTVVSTMTRAGGIAPRPALGIVNMVQSAGV